jgi:hypothetical protein
MFAYCPLLSQRNCGISKETTAEPELYATDIEQVVYSKEMRYRGGSQKVREYDFCHYELQKSRTMTDERIKTLREEATGG